MLQNFVCCPNKTFCSNNQNLIDLTIFFAGATEEFCCTNTNKIFFWFDKTVFSVQFQLKIALKKLKSNTRMGAYSAHFKAGDRLNHMNKCIGEYFSTTFLWKKNILLKIWEIWRLPSSFLLKICKTNFFRK